MKHVTYNTKLIILTAILFFVSCFMFYDSVTANIQLETGLPNIPPAGLTTGNELPEYINYLYLFGLGLIALLALVQMMIGGLTYIFAAGNVAKFEIAKDTIKQALLGLGLLLVSYLFLRTINPDLVNLRNPSLTLIEFAFQDANWRWTSGSCSNFGSGWGATSAFHCEGARPSVSAVCCGLHSPRPQDYRWALIPAGESCDSILDNGLFDISNWQYFNDRHCQGAGPEPAHEVHDPPAAYYCCGKLP